MNRAVPNPDEKIKVETGLVPTVDGTRIEINQLNVGIQESGADLQAGWFRRVKAKVSLFLAGMYTGIGCSGVPHSHHTYGSDRDKRPL